MDSVKEKLEKWMIDLTRRELREDARYRQWAEENEQAFARFREEYPRETVSACIDLLDLNDLMSEQEVCRAFWLGLRLGLTAAREG